ncbi:MAG: ABC transporter permease subunit [Planctomycetota bacterium]|nr:ABC transporter permease subunit [Planctomycetota bacterium]
MKGTLIVFRSEWYRLTRTRATLFAAFFVASVASLRVFAAWVAHQATHTAAVKKALAAGREVPEILGPGNAFAPFFDGWLAGLTVGTLLLLIFSSRALASDLEAGMLRLSRTRTCSRSSLVLGRALLGVPLVLATLIISALAAAGTASLFFDYGPFIEYGDVLVTMEELQGEVRHSFLTALAPLLATWTFGLLVSSMSRSGTSAVGAGIAVYLAFDLFKEVLGKSQYWIFAAFNPSFVDNSYMKEAASMAEGYSDAGFSEGLYLQNLVIPWPEAILFVSLASFVIYRRRL